MNTKTLGITIAVAIIAVAGGIAYMQSRGSAAPAPTTSDTQGTMMDTASSTVSGSTTGEKTYTTVDVAAHKDDSSCWTIIDGSVYDLTQWVSQHPGGEQAILSICGVDGSAAFHGQHGNNPRQENILATFKIGTLAQ